MFRTHTRTLLAAAALIVLTTACSPVQAELVDVNATYDEARATSLLESVDAGDVAGKPVAETDELRSAALVNLRNQGDAGTEIADLVTRTFPPGTRGVPVYAEKARYDGDEAWLVIEVIGKSGGELKDKRLWVLDPQGAILFSAVR